MFLVSSSQLTHYDADIMCPPGVTGIFPYPFDYTVFINCRNGQTAIQNCPANMVFNIVKGYCDKADKVSHHEKVNFKVSDVSYEYGNIKNYAYFMLFILILFLFSSYAKYMSTRYKWSAFISF